MNRYSNSFVSFTLFNFVSEASRGTKATIAVASTITTPTQAVTPTPTSPGIIFEPALNFGPFTAQG